MSLSRLTRLCVFGGLGLSISAAAVFLMLYLRRRERMELESMLCSMQPRSKSPGRHVVSVKIPRKALGAVIGRNGATLKSIQETTKTKISFPRNDRDIDECVALIRGHPDDTREAEQMIFKAIKERTAIETSEIFISPDACERIIGRNGENIRYMCRMSKAKINVDYPDRARKCHLQRVTIRGTPDQIEFVKALITQKLAELVQEQTNSSSNSNIDPNKERKLLCIGSPDDTRPYRPDDLRSEQLKSTSSDGFIEVFISAVETPHKFWVQVVQGMRAVDLDKLVEEMTDYYSEDDNKKNHVLQEVSVGDLVAAPFSHDQSWYRAKVEELEEDSYSPEERKLRLFYVDFGDRETLSAKDVFELDKSCQQLPLQALECRLGEVKPAMDSWTSEAIQSFGSLTYAAQWKVIMLKVLKPNGSGDVVENDLIPAVVKLVDTNGTTDVDIACELVNQGHAVFENE